MTPPRVTWNLAAGGLLPDAVTDGVLGMACENGDPWPGSSIEYVESMLISSKSPQIDI